MNLDQIKLCVFDVDGVLVNSRLLHYPATMFALKDFGYHYTREEDESFGTIPTRQKLNLLAEQGKIEKELIDYIWDLKDEYACQLFENNIVINDEIKPLFENLKTKQIKIALASNARYSFLNKVVDKLNVSDHVDLILSAQSVIPKPDPAIYVSAMNYFNIKPKNTLIFEDSEIGKQAAYASKANVYEITNFDELTRYTFENHETYCTPR
ncbi:HAD-superfamily hydrolase [Synechococcus phage DSL-LC03]|nr:HAD-superfamily hydrolase [Synechococcus phage DSL-LC03]